MDKKVKSTRGRTDRAVFEHSAISLWEEDISELRAAIRGLRAREVLDLEGYLSTHAEFVREATRMIKVVDVNAATLKLYEARSKGDLLGSLDTTLDPDDPVMLGSIRRMILAIDRGETQYVQESTAVTPRGKKLSIILHSYIPESDDETMLVNVLDITEQRRTEIELRESEERYRALVENLGEGLVIVDPGENIVFVNPAAEASFGVPARGLPGRNLREFFTDEKFSVVRGETEKRARGERSTYETEITRADGSVRHVRVTATPQYDKDGRFSGTFGLLYDLTDRRETEEALRRSEEQLQQAKRLEAVGRLAGGIAHDFNNLLTVIKGYTDLVDARLEERTQAKSDLQEIRKASNRAVELTAQLLAFSRKQVLQPRVINLNDIVKSTEKMLARIIGEDIDLRSYCPPEIGNVKADPGQIEQVLMNLAANSRDAMPNGGKLTVETANISLGESYVRAHPEVTVGQYVMLAVSDTGVGMSEQTRTRVFEPFFTTKEVGKGTGLGLATVYGIVKQSAGYIFCYSEEGIGTTFKIYFPREYGQKATGSGPTRGGQSIRGEEGILLVEDEEAIRGFMLTVLENAGYTVWDTKNGSEALELVSRRHMAIQLLLTDIVMPKMNGPQLAARMREIYSGVKVLYMSGYTENAAIHHGILDAEIDLLQKPFEAHELLARVRTALDMPAKKGENIDGLGER